MDTNLFDEINKKAQMIIEFHLITHGIMLTQHEKDCVEIGCSSGITAAIEHYNGN